MSALHIRVSDQHRPLQGTLVVSGAKNAALPILAAALLSDASLALSRVPHLTDVTTMIELLGTLGVSVLYSEKNILTLCAKDVETFSAPYALVKKMRASFLVLGPLLGRFGYASVSLPGGCAIGARPVFEHLHGLEQLGATIEVENGCVKATAPKDGLVGASIHMEKVSVTGTENLIMAAVLANGTTEITNAAKEPEVTDLIDCLNAMGAHIEGAGTDHLVIEGVAKLHGASHTIIPDRIEAGTYLIAAALSRGHIALQQVRPDHLTAVLEHLRQAGANIDVGADSITLCMDGQRPKAVSMVTAVYPGFPTDLQAQWSVLNAVGEGSSTITEQIFDNRMMHVPALQRMGANIRLSGSVLSIEGKPFLTGAMVEATDLRASACLVLAAIMAPGETQIGEIFHIDRGYERIEDKFSQLGVTIRRVPANAYEGNYEKIDTE